MLGPSMMLLGTPLAAITSLVAFVKGRDRRFAIAALVLATLEVLGLLALFGGGLALS